MKTTPSAGQGDVEKVTQKMAESVISVTTAVSSSVAKNKPFVSVF